MTLDAYKEKKRAAARKWQQDNPERAKERKRQWYLKNRELCIQRAARNKPKKGTRVILTPEMREQRKIEIKQYRSDYYKNNKDTIIDRWKKHKKGYMQNPLFRLKEALRTRIRTALVRKGFAKNGRTMEVVGCTFEEFVSHIENQFIDGMSWDNQGEWHLDHIVPVSIATTEDDILKLNNYKNIRPLFAKDNMCKSDNMIDDFIPLRGELLGW